jgi:hypothetical protein
MEHLKRVCFAALLALALMAWVSGSASATTLEVGGVTQNNALTFTASLEPGTTAVLIDTNNFTQDTCTESHMHGTTTSPYTGASVGGPLTSLSFGGCTHTTDVAKPGSLSVSSIAGTTDGTVTSSGTEVTFHSTIFEVILICKTNTGVDIGRLTGKTSTHATLDVVAVVNCGFFVPTARWEGSYVVTSPTGLGVSA